MAPDSRIRWTAYPALGLALLLALGIFLDAVASPPLGAWVGLAVVGCSGFVAGDRRSRTRLVSLGPVLRLTGAALCLVAAGGARHHLFDHPAPRDLSALLPPAGPGQPASTGRVWLLSGTVDGPPTRRDRSVGFVLRVDRIREAALPAAGDTAGAVPVQGRVWVRFQTPVWRDRASTPDGEYPSVSQGVRLHVAAPLDRPSGRRNPAGFDAAAYFRRSGVCCTATVWDPSAVRRVGSSTSLLPRLVVRGRAAARMHFQAFVPTPRAQSVLEALLLGNRSGLDALVVDAFRAAGLLHLLAVSGLHVFFVGLAAHALLGPTCLRLGLRWRAMEAVRAALVLGLLAYYVLLTGARPSVVRAVVMAGCFIGATVLQRSSTSLNTLGVAAVLLLAASPASLFDVGFQLSMAAVAGILTLRPRVDDALSRLPLGKVRGSWVQASTAVTLAATLATAPVLAHHFGPVPLAGTALNLLGIPLTAASLAAGIGVIATASAAPGLAVPLGAAADLLARLLLAVASAGADALAWVRVDLGPASDGYVAALAAGLVAVAQAPRPRLRWRWVLAALALAAATAVPGCVRERTGPVLDLIFFDVGQGDAALVTTPGGRRLLVDTGPGSVASSAARYAVLPYLRRQGVDRLDAVVVTHPDQDHLGGLPDLLRHVQVDRIYRSGWAATTDLFESVSILLEDFEIPSRALRAGDRVPIGDPAVRIEVLAPAAGTSPSSANDGSVVLRIAYGGTVVLLPGDVERGSERGLLERYGPFLRSDVVKIPHHGSATSSTPAFIEAVAGPRPLHAVVSVRSGNRHGLPDPEVIRRWQETGARVHRTSTHGAVWLRSDGDWVWRHDW